MATYNTRVVRRSAVLLDYGPHFRYREISAFGNPLTATLATAGLGALAGGLAFGPTRKLLDRVLPDPGEGPSEKSRESGYFKMEVHGAGRRATVAAKGDPGYAATAVMMGESRALPRARRAPGPLRRPHPRHRDGHRARRAPPRGGHDAHHNLKGLAL